MECYILLLTLLLIIKEYEVSSQRTGRSESANQPTISSFFHPDLYSYLGAIDQPLYMPCHSDSYSSYLPQIIIDNTRDDDDDWLSLLYFLIIALKDRKSGCSYKNERPRYSTRGEYRRDDYYDDKYVSDSYYCEKCGCKSSRRGKEYHEDNYKCVCDQNPFGINNIIGGSGGCGCIFIPYPVAVSPLNFANGQLYNDIEICSCGNESCNKILCNGKETNEINLIIRAE